MKNRTEIGLWIFGATFALNIQFIDKVYSPGGDYYVSNNWDKVEYKTVFLEEEASQNLDYKVEEPPVEFSTPTDLVEDNITLSSGGIIPLPFNAEDTFVIDLEKGIFTAESDIKVYAPFNSTVVDVYPNVRTGVVNDVQQIYNSSDGVTLTIVSDDTYDIGDTNPVYLKLKISSLSRTYASEKHTPQNAYSSIKDENLRIYYTDFSETGQIKALQKSVLGRFGKTGNIEGKDIKDYKTYCKLEVYKSQSKDSADWVKIPITSIYGKDGT